MKIVSIVGARPQFIKSAPVSSAVEKAGYEEYIVHTGQHYDRDMSKIFFEELGIKEPFINLNVGSGTHAQQTGQMLMGIETVLLERNPNYVLVYGDTNSTLAGALAAVKLGIRVAHIEAGLRSFNRQMPEEHNRVLTDHCSDLLFCPTETAVNNLSREGVEKGVHLVGDTMYDALLRFSPIANLHSTILKDLEISPKNYFLATIHRPYNTDDPQVLSNILAAFGSTDRIIIFPIHPRTLHMVEKLNIRIAPNVRIINPVGYLDMLTLEQNALVILTDSGGVQKEAYLLKVKCLTLRPETEWVETVLSGWNTVVGTNQDRIISALEMPLADELPHPQLFGDGNASSKIVDLLI